MKNLNKPDPSNPHKQPHHQPGQAPQQKPMGPKNPERKGHGGCGGSCGS